MPIKICIVANDIRSAHNIGSLFRSCDGFGAELVLVGISPRPTGGAYEDRLPHIANRAEKDIAKTALGAERNVKWRYCQNFDDAIRLLKSEHFSIVALEQASHAQSLQSFTLSQDTALIVGTEVTGLTALQLALCDAVYEIPMLGTKESYNVAVAAGIALYHGRVVSGCKTKAEMVE